MEGGKRAEKARERRERGDAEVLSRLESRAKSAFQPSILPSLTPVRSPARIRRRARELSNGSQTLRAPRESFRSRSRARGGVYICVCVPYIQM